MGLELDEIQMRQRHWAVVDLIGKGGHILGVGNVQSMSSNCSIGFRFGLLVATRVPQVIEKVEWG